MIFIQIAERDDAAGFLALAKSGLPITCLPKNIYGVHQEHLRILRRGKVSFKKLSSKDIPLPKPRLAA